MNKYLGHWITEIIDGLYFLGGDVFSLCQLENVLLSVSDLQSAVLQKNRRETQLEMKVATDATPPDSIHRPTTIIKVPFSLFCLQEAISQCLLCAAIHPCQLPLLFSQDLSGIPGIHLVL